LMPDFFEISSRVPPPKSIWRAKPASAFVN
jgi:hypothetical protein